MSFFTYRFDNGCRQRADIEQLREQARAKARGSRRRARKLEDQGERIEALEDQVGELALICRALLSTLRESGAIDPAQYAEVLARIDAEDGVVDGKVTPPAARPKAKEGPRVRRKRRR